MKTAMKDAKRKLLYADDLALVANDKQELHDTLEEWNELFSRHGLTLNLEKTESAALNSTPEGRFGHRAGREETDLGQGWDGRTVLREMWRRQMRRKTERRRQDTEDNGKYYQMRWRRNCGQHLTPDRGKKTKRESVYYSPMFCRYESRESCVGGTIYVYVYD